jgi:hypothetical protein
MVFPKVKAAFTHTPFSDSEMTPAYLKMGRNIAGCYPTVNMTKPLQTLEEVEKLVNKAADCQINAMRGRHKQNKKQTDKKVV